MPISRRKPSALRCWTFTIAAIGTIAVITTIISCVAYTGSMPDNPAYDLLIRATSLVWVAFLAALVRDEILEQLKPMSYQLNDLESEVTEYGDVREVQGHQLAIRILRPGDTNGGRLRSVE